MQTQKAAEEESTAKGKCGREAIIALCSAFSRHILRKKPIWRRVERGGKSAERWKLVVPPPFFGLESFNSSAECVLYKSDRVTSLRTCCGR